MQVAGRECDPGMQGGVPQGRFVFSHADQNSAGVLRRERRRPNGSRTAD